MKKLTASKLIAAFMLLLCFKAEAVETTFLNNTFKINLPENYCTLNQDTNYYKFTKAAFGNSVKFGFIAAPCMDTKALEEGIISRLSHYIAFTQIGIAGNYGYFKLGRFVYVNLAKAFKSAPLDRVENSVNRRIAPFGATVSNLGYKLQSASDSYALFLATVNLNGFGADKKANLLGITTLVYEIPVGLYVFDEDPNEAKTKEAIKQLSIAASSF